MSFAMLIGVSSMEFGFLGVLSALFSFLWLGLSLHVISAEERCD